MKETSNILRPGEIERASLAIISRELDQRGIVLEAEHAAVVKRVIHATADFDYAETLRFAPRACLLGSQALRRGTAIVTDTNMARSGISAAAMEALGCRAVCFMAEEAVAREAKSRGITRAAVSMEKAAQEVPGAVLAVGNAPTALLRIADLVEQGLRPALVIGVPVGFVNVEESKIRLFSVCQACEVPAIVAMGRKGGSTVAAAICNALLYTAARMLDPADRGWG